MSNPDVVMRPLADEDLLSTQIEEPQLPATADELQIRGLSAWKSSAPDSDAAEWFQSCPAWTGVPAHSLKAVAVALEERSYQAGAILIEQGRPTEGLFIVRQGSVEIRLTQNEQETRTIGLVGSGQLLGEMSLLSDEPATATAIARTATRLYFLPVEKFHELTRSEPWLSVVLTYVMASRLGSAHGDVLSGKVLGGFQIVRRLASGGMSVVYEGMRLADRLRVALKMMSHRLVYDERSRDRFQQEADLIERLDHPSIVRMRGRFQAFHTEFLAMDYCEGEDLRSRLARHGLPSSTWAARVLAQLAGALAYAHDAGVIHRDVKPSNVMIDRMDRAILVDFGLAKPVLDTTEAGHVSIVGTPAYMAPEQLAGLPVTPRVDYFSLGCVAFELFMGRRLLHESSVEKIRRRHQAWEVPKLAEQLPPRLQPLGRLIETCLAKDPADRPLSLEDFSKIARQVTA